MTSAQMVEPNRVMETIKAVKVEAYPKGGWIIDMGKDFTGWAEIRLPSIAKGATVKLEYSDQLEPDKPVPSVSATGAPRSLLMGACLLPPALRDRLPGRQPAFLPSSEAEIRRISPTPSTSVTKWWAMANL